MSQQKMKIMAAQAALKQIPANATIGIGTGSTVDYFIEQLCTIKNNIKATIASSNRTSQLLIERGFEVIELNAVNELTLYVDGADAYNNIKQLIKGKGGALTREKILATASKKFICLVDQTKTNSLATCPIPIEVIPMARSYVAREMVKLGGQPQLRNNFITDNGNVILDVYNMPIEHPIRLETQLNSIPGIVENGLFAIRNADQIIIGHTESVEILD
jgi:ribose 5-phosphate isomerase A